MTDHTQVRLRHDGGATFVLARYRLQIDDRVVVPHRGKAEATARAIAIAMQKLRSRVATLHGLLQEQGIHADAFRLRRIDRRRMQFAIRVADGDIGTTVRIPDYYTGCRLARRALVAIEKLVARADGLRTCLAGQIQPTVHIEQLSDDEFVARHNGTELTRGSLPGVCWDVTRWAAAEGLRLGRDLVTNLDLTDLLSICGAVESIGSREGWESALDPIAGGLRDLAR